VEHVFTGVCNYLDNMVRQRSVTNL
jgi:hypothetical protein